jgi:hypothetical protein
MTGAFDDGLSAEDRQRVRFWVDALLKGGYKAAAAGELHSIGIRTRGAIRTRGSVAMAAPPRFPAGAESGEILKLIQRDASPDLRKRVAAALGEWAGGDAIPVLRDLVIGPSRDPDPTVRCAVLGAIGLIAGPESLGILREVSASDDDSTVASFALSLAQSIR